VDGSRAVNVPADPRHIRSRVALMGKSNAVGLCSGLAILQRYYRADRRMAGYGSLRMDCDFRERV
jgi:hypothetical protein